MAPSPPLQPSSDPKDRISTRASAKKPRRSFLERYRTYDEKGSFKLPATINELERCRLLAGIRQLPLANILGWTQSTVSRIEVAPDLCYVKTINEYLSAFGLTLAIVPLSKLTVLGEAQFDPIPTLRNLIETNRQESAKASDQPFET